MRSIIIKSSIPLTQEQKNKLENAMQKKYKEEELRFNYTLENVVGGVVIIDGEKVYDSTVATSLHNFKQKSLSYINKHLSPGRAELPMLWASKLADMVSLDISHSFCGRVIASADGILTIDGLSECVYFELLKVGKDDYAIAMNLMSDCVKAMLITSNKNIEYGAVVNRTGKTVEVPVGENLLGRVINPLGKPIDGISVLHFDKTDRIEKPAPKIMDRSKVNRPLETGILAVDSMVPIGRGQRELIIGDRQTGKSSIAIDAIINQRDKNVICIYVAIGQRGSNINQLVQKLVKANAMQNTVVVVSTADDSAALQYIAPYTGCTIAEEFMNQGKDVLIVYDDLTKHANAYRSISLLLKRPSGREAYPGDIFYIHSKLLERSAQLSKEKGGGSITAIPIVETQAGDISQYIPTNVISITDGQIYLESELFHSGVRPALNVGLSVSRVGGSAQYKGIKKLSAQLRLDLAHFREMELFTQFGADVDENTKAILDKGRKITELLKQREGEPMSVDKEIIYLYIINKHLAKIPENRVKEYVSGFYSYFVNSSFTDVNEIRANGFLSEKMEKVIDEDIKNYNIYFFNKRK